jgi:hypothetical protein
VTHHGAPARRSDRLALAAVALVGGLTLLVARWGQDLIAAGTRLSANAAPFHGRWRDTVASPIEAAAVFRRSWSRRRGRVLAARGEAPAPAGVPWAAALSSVGGPARRRARVARAGNRSRRATIRASPGRWTIGRFLSTTSIACRDTRPACGHPPGAVVGFWVLTASAFARAVGFTVFAIAASSAAAVVITLARLVGAVARRGAVIASSRRRWCGGAPLMRSSWRSPRGRSPCRGRGPHRAAAPGWYAAAGVRRAARHLDLQRLRCSHRSPRSVGCTDARRTHRGACARPRGAGHRGVGARRCPRLAGFSGSTGSPHPRRVLGGRSREPALRLLAIANVVLVLAAGRRRSAGSLDARSACDGGPCVPAWSSRRSAIAGVARTCRATPRAR